MVIILYCVPQAAGPRLPLPSFFNVFPLCALLAGIAANAGSGRVDHRQKHIFIAVMGLRACFTKPTRIIPHTLGTNNHRRFGVATITRDNRLGISGKDLYLSLHGAMVAAHCLNHQFCGAAKIVLMGYFFSGRKDIFHPIVFFTIPTSFSGSNGFLTKAMASLMAWSPSIPLITMTGVSRKSLSLRSLR